jgi:uncharacterized protein involved in outer membrane biogenesis
MRRLLLLGLGVLLLLPVLATAGFLLFFDADAFRPRVVEAVQRATGREFRIEGKLRLTPALTPTLTAEGLVLANVAGGSAPEMLRIAQAEIRLALLPLFSGRVELANLRLDGGRLMLERENWRFTRPAPAPSAAATPAAAPSRPIELDVRVVTLHDWEVTAGKEVLRLPDLRLTGSGPGAPLDLTATLAIRGAEARVEGRLGPPNAWNGPEPWPFRLAATLPHARLTAEGRQANGDWGATLVAEIPRLEALSPVAGRPLPALAGITLRAEARLAGGAATISNIEGQATGGDVAGIVLTAARLTQAAPEAPLLLEASGQLRGEGLTLAAELRPLALLAGTPAPLALRLAAAGASASLSGEWPGALRVSAAAPELARLSALAGRPLPPLRETRLSAAVIALGPLFGEGLRLGEFDLASSAGDLSGALEWRWAPRPTLNGRLTSTRLDLNALRLPEAAQPVAPPVAATAPAAPAAPASGRVIPDTALDLAALRLFDADVSVALGEVIERGLTLRQLEGRLVNAGGQARLDPFAATLPGGRLSLALAADARGTAPALQVRGGGQGLDPVALLGAFGLTGPLTGRTDLDMDLRGEGATWRALAASASGHFGLAITEGRLTGGPALALAQIPGFAAGVPVTCLAVRGEADRGLVRFSAFYLDGAAGRLAGEGGMSLRDETLAIRMQGDLRLAGVRVRAPIPLGGTLAAPRLELAALTEGAVGSLLGAPGGGAGGVAMPDCAGALRIARGGREGPVPQAAPSSSGQSQPSINNLLRGLLGR